jgi:hypothetical protein
VQGKSPGEHCEEGTAQEAVQEMRRVWGASRQQGCGFEEAQGAAERGGHHACMRACVLAALRRRRALCFTPRHVIGVIVL